MTYIHPKGHDQIMRIYGLFMVIWSVLETVIEVAIMKQLNLDPLRSNIVTSGLGFERRASVLRSLLALHGDTHKEATKILNQVTQEAKRNTLVHGHIFVGDDTITFVKRATDQKFSVSRTEFTGTKLQAHVSSISDKVGQLQVLLNVTDDDIRAFANIGDSLASKSATSGKPHTS